jgi:phosphatidylglycerol:prolipoprotein diacylglycerol transferase
MRDRAARRRGARHGTGRATTLSPKTVTLAPSSPTGEPSEAQALVVTHYFDADDLEGSATVRLTGKRVGSHGRQNLTDVFTQDDRIDDIEPGCGPTSVTSWVYGLAPGEWAVTAEVVSTGDRRRPVFIARAGWSFRRWALSADAPTTVRTRLALLAPLARVPGVIPGIWPALGAAAVMIALVMQRIMQPHENVSVDVPIVVPLAALAAGLLGAKVWYAVLHPGPLRRALLGGWAVDGFLVVAPIVAVLSLLALGLPVAAFLDAVTPGLFLAVAIGRIGCFFAGCCAGRYTKSRWGIWSSDRKVGARRIPAQILESAAGLAIAAISTFVILVHAPRIDGTIFVGALVAYLVVRQALLRLRAERREFLWRRSGTARLSS